MNLKQFLIRKLMLFFTLSTLITVARSFEFFHSEHRQPGTTSRELHPDPMFEMSPAAAEARGLNDGDWCWI